MQLSSVHFYGCSEHNFHKLWKPGSAQSLCPITLSAVHTRGKEQFMRIKLKWHGFPDDGLCYKPDILARFLMYAELFEWHWFQDTSGCILTKSYYFLKAEILQQCTSEGAVIAIELPRENPSSTEPLNKGKHDQDVENESPHSWIPEIPEMIPLNQALWEARPRAHTAVLTGTAPLNILLFFCCSPGWATDIWDPSRLSALIKKLHIPPGCRGKLRKVCSIRTENKGTQTKGGLYFRIGQSILAQILLEYAAWNKDLIKNISRLNCENW